MPLGEPGLDIVRPCAGRALHAQVHGVHERLGDPPSCGSTWCSQSHTRWECRRASGHAAPLRVAAPRKRARSAILLPICAIPSPGGTARRPTAPRCRPVATRGLHAHPAGHHMQPTHRLTASASAIALLELQAFSWQAECARLQVRPARMGRAHAARHAVIAAARAVAGAPCMHADRDTACLRLRLLTGRCTSGTRGVRAAQHIPPAWEGKKRALLFDVTGGPSAAA